MFKLIIKIIALSILVFSCSVVFAEENYCKDPESWKEWDLLVAKHPNDMDVQMLHALRIGLCAKIEQGSITFEQANDIMNGARDAVIHKKKKREEKLKDDRTL
jgi:hypothetical protein